MYIYSRECNFIILYLKQTQMYASKHKQTRAKKSHAIANEFTLYVNMFSFFLTWKHALLGLFGVNPTSIWYRQSLGGSRGWILHCIKFPVNNHFLFARSANLPVKPRDLPAYRTLFLFCQIFVVEYHVGYVVTNYAVGNKSGVYHFWTRFDYKRLRLP